MTKRNMANTFFQFKQFTIYQDKCAMKVGTDGVLLGTWADVTDSSSILDIGTGTGLIAIMLAQRNQNSKIQAIDTDSLAIEQALGNAAQSPFAAQIQCEHISLQEFSAKHTHNRYDHIVSNPPYFADSLKSPDLQRTTARHSDSLQMEELVAIAKLHLSENGKLSLIYPHEELDTLQAFATKYNLHTTRITHVYPTPTSAAKRILIELSTKPSPLIENNLTIEKTRHVYTDEFTSLARNFYIKI